MKTVFVVKEERMGWYRILGIYSTAEAAGIRAIEEWQEDERFDPSHYYYDEYEVMD